MINKKIAIYLLKSILTYKLMEINYDLIIKYLVKKNSKGESNTKSKPNNFITQKNIFNYSVSFPDKFKDLLTDKFYRYGITVNDNEHNNISFWSSILTLVDKNFIIPYSSDELELITQFKTQLIEKYSKSKLSTFLKDLDKNDLRERFKLEQDIYTLQYLVDILDINILIFDWENQNIYSMYHKDKMNPWKKTILLAKFKKYWEPIMMVKIKGEIDRLFDYNNSTIKKILTTENISYFEGDKINKQFILNDDVYSIVQQEKSILKVKEPIVEDLKESQTKELIDEDSDTDSSVKTNDEADVFTDEDEFEKLKKLNKTKLTKMKLDELIKLVDKLKIVITKKNPTKGILIDTILAKLT
jgi:hypothetical protein